MSQPATKRARANRRNAARSTGPKSAAGKARSAQNARTHGLAAPILGDPAFAPQVARLAAAIAGAAADEERRAAAARIAEAHVELLRIRQRRMELLQEHLLPRGRRGSRQGSMLKLRISRGVIVHYEDRRPAPVAPWDAAEYFRTALHRLQRYERRALSRRRQAIAAFDGCR